MSKAETEQKKEVFDILKDLNGLDPLKELFWHRLSYARVNQTLSRTGWSDTSRSALAEDPVLFAGGGKDNDFHVIYARLVSDKLLIGQERPVATRLLRDHPYALFVFSNASQDRWHFLNVKYDTELENRRLFRRITIGPEEKIGQRLRTACERLSLIDLDTDKQKPSDFTPLAIQDLHDDAFDVEAVTKTFYKELADWYFWALKHICFPKDAPKEADGHDHIAVIRMITRLIFCWFVKEKGLIPEVLFDQRRLDELLNGFAPDKDKRNDSVFYKAILQNLFFATLNTEMDKRGWAKEEQNFMAHSLYRHRDLFKKPGEALGLFKNIPFLNGGLFECLDKDLGESAKPRYVRIDGFSRRPDCQPVVPDFLFFGPEREEDLSADYGDKKYRKVLVRGLIQTFYRYHFTIEENTPIDQEVALDPELSGKVFENLLAAYNPETGATARKQTGSFYTPREIVDYMVDEALIAYFKGSTTTENTEAIEKKLRRLMSWEEGDHNFDARETEALIAAIDGLKALDPAVGSGAFPMGILHKLVFILGKLDPRNERWEQRQIQRVRDAMATAEKIEDAAIRERTVKELEQQIVGIEESFQRNELDYGRKLYLIENCLYGVDIQSIAVQIAKMRFFISLIVDQRVDPNAPNLGVRPLPNLETKFVAANTLIGIEKPNQMSLRNPQIKVKEAELHHVREKHFTARTLSSKAKCREQDKELRGEVAGLLKSDGWDNTTAKQLTAWDPYDQNTSAPFFDPEWMFGVRDGFDVILGNPPYLNVELVPAEQKKYFAEHFTTFYKRYDIFGLFFEVSLTRLSNGRSSVAFIVPQQVANNLSYKKLRDMMLENRWLREVLYLGDKVFAEANNDVCVLFLTKPTVENIRLVYALDFDKREITEVTVDHFKKYGNVISFSSDAGGEGVFAKIFNPSFARIKDHFDVFQGIVTGNNAAFLPAEEDIKHSRIEKSLLHPVLLGRDFGKWLIRNEERRILYVDGETNLEKYPNTEKWLLPFRSELKKRRECLRGVTPWFSLQWPRVKAQLDQVPKILLQRTRNPRLKTRVVATIDDQGFYGMESIIFIAPKVADAPLYFLLGILNSSTINYLYQTKFLNVAVKAEYLKDTPIPIASQSQGKILASLVSRILSAKTANPAVDITALEDEIDRIVYELYGLTEKEIRIVEGGISK